MMYILMCNFAQLDITLKQQIFNISNHVNMQLI